MTVTKGKRHVRGSWAKTIGSDERVLCVVKPRFQVLAYAVMPFGSSTGMMLVVNNVQLCPLWSVEAKILVCALMPQIRTFPLSLSTSPQHGDKLGGNTDVPRHSRTSNDGGAVPEASHVDNYCGTYAARRFLRPVVLQVKS
ncbi:hypothetical protein IAQ61_000159 [Plenodomus lingam]|uniref:uncharacterized protein n=1 Tax=Leptosphaeria maculans TaxID=5022 RepID=UPI00332FD0D7|nr:hypothetical protein IAQ61_000159 [Plenodomus lingam]